VDERSANASDSRESSADTPSREVDAVNDELLATLAEVEP
jgi:hypothetical protein